MGQVWGGLVEGCYRKASKCWLSRQGHSREGPGTKSGTVDPGQFGRSTRIVHRSACPTSPSSLMCRGQVQGPPPQAAGRASSWTLCPLCPSCAGVNRITQVPPEKHSVWCCGLRNSQPLPWIRLNLPSHRSHSTPAPTLLSSCGIQILSDLRDSAASCASSPLLL